MKKIFYSLLLINFSISVFAQDAQIQWQKIVENSLAGSILQTGNDYVITGSHLNSKPGVGGDYDGAIIKTNNLGVTQWEYFVSSQGFQYSYSIQKINSYGFAVLSLTDYNAFDIVSDPVVTRLEENGSLIWENVFSNFYTFGAFDFNNIYTEKYGAILDATDGFFVVGSQKDSFFPIPNENTDCSLMKLSTDGTVKWKKKYGGTNNEVAADLVSSYDGNYIFVGATSSNDGDVVDTHVGSDFWIVKIDNLGDILWQKRFGGLGEEKAQAIKMTSDGGCIIVGNTNSNDGDVLFNHGGFDAWIIKIDSFGNMQWQKSLGGSNDEFAQSIHVTSEGEFLIAGHSNSNDGDVSNNHGGFDIWLIKLNDLGEIQWEKCFGGSANDYIENKNSFQKTTDGKYVFLGTTYSNDGDVIGNNTVAAPAIWFVKLDDVVLSTSEITQSNDIRIYPNPVSETLYFSEEFDSITIYTIYGQKIKQAANLKEINLGWLSSGVYLLEVGNENSNSSTFKFVKQ